MANAKHKEPKTNVEFVTDLMEFSRFGALAQLFIIDALDKWSKIVADAPPIEHPMVNGTAWKGVAAEIQRKIAERN
jgi:hypothetical protein